MQLLAPAKINLHLRVGPVDASTGFHPLMSWFCTISLFDTLTIEPADDAGKISLTCSDPALPCDERNLVVRAAVALQRVADPTRKARGVQMQLEKRIPSGGGLGGGSSDAARTLLGINQMWNLNLSVDQLSGIAASLGSDVPFFLHAASAVCTSRGEIVRPIEKPRPKWVLLILPDYSISTPAVYRKFDELRLGESSSITNQPDWQQWADLSAGPLLAGLVNDLEAPAFALCPQLQTLHAEIQKQLSRIVRMSGSGSSLFSLFDDFAEAKSAAAHIEQCCGVKTLVTALCPQLDDDLPA